MSVCKKLKVNLTVVNLTLKNIVILLHTTNKLSKQQVIHYKSNNRLVIYTLFLFLRYSIGNLLFICCTGVIN